MRMDACMKNSSPMMCSKSRAFAPFIALVLTAALLLAGCAAEKKPDGPLTETEKAGFKERNARH